MISETECARSYTEVYELLKYVPKPYFEKIPSNTIKFFEKNRDMSYNFQVNPKLNYHQNTNSPITKAIMSNIYRDFWCSENEKEQLLREEQETRITYRKMVSEIYNPNSIFQNGRDIQKEIEVKEVAQNVPGITVVDDGESFFEMIVRKFKEFFRKKQN